MKRSNSCSSESAEQIFNELYPSGISNLETAYYINDFIEQLLDMSVEREEIKEILINEFLIEDPPRKIDIVKVVGNLFEIALPVLFILLLANLVSENSYWILCLTFLTISVFCFLEKPLFSFAILRKKLQLSSEIRKKVMFFISFFYLCLALLFAVYPFLKLDTISPISIITLAHGLLYLRIYYLCKE